MKVQVLSRAPYLKSKYSCSNGSHSQDMKCYLCNSTENLTKDHVPPKRFFPSPRPSNLITVPCCSKCNAAYSKDDEAIRAWFSTLLGRSAAGDWIFENKVVRGIAARSPQFREAILASIQEVKLRTENGIVDAARIKIPWNRAERFLVRCVKGLITYHYPSYDYSSDHFEVCHVPSNNEALDKIAPLRDYLLYEELGVGVFQYRRGITDTSMSGVWILVFLPCNYLCGFSQ